MVELAENDLGGCKLASAAISGSGAVYGQLKFESGIHRVQRVPVTESGACWHAGAGGAKGAVVAAPVWAAAGPGDVLGWLTGQCIRQTASFCARSSHPLPCAGGRVHTSAASVAVLPQADEMDVSIRDEDLRIDTYR
jgi:protein subunit release factor A